MRRRPLTRLGQFMVDHRIRIDELADVAGVSSAHIRNLRRATGVEPRRCMMLWITEAASYLVRQRVDVAELFELAITLDERRLRRK
jgi:myo-inositol catabolism protein IolC